MKQDCLRCLLLLGAVSIIAVTIILVGLVQEWTNEKLGVVIEMGLALAVVGLVLLACDWNALGPNVAVHHSTLAVATALLIAVPLGLIIFALIEWEPITGLVILCIIAAGAPFLAFGFTGCCFGSVVAYAIIMLSGTMKNASKIDPVLATRLSILGIALVLVSVYMPVRKSITLRRIEDWTGMVEVDPRSDEFRERAQFFAESCDLRADKYPFRLGIVSLYRTIGPTWEPKRGHLFGLLFHGTSWEGAKGIIANGFQLPDYPGMFGKGIYFADSPLKSWQYASREEAIPTPCCPALPCCNRGGLILMSLVDMGEQRREEQQANVQLRGYNRQSLWACLTCQTGAYDSVVGLSEEQGGILRVPEYVVYNPRQARVDYIFEVSTEPG